MVDQYHHGIRLVEVSNGARSLVTVATAIIGMVCTGPNADAAIATVFHWAPSAMDPMPLPELIGWHARALKRHNPES